MRQSSCRIGWVALTYGFKLPQKPMMISFVSQSNNYGGVHSDLLANWRRLLLTPVSNVLIPPELESFKSVTRWVLASRSA